MLFAEASRYVLPKQAACVLFFISGVRVLVQHSAKLLMFGEKIYVNERRKNIEFALK